MVVTCFFLLICLSTRLASVYLEEEKGRIRRLRKIKSVLASGNFMGVGAHLKSTSHKLYQGRRRWRPYNDVSQREVGNAEPRHQGHLPTVAFPNYPTRPFGNVDTSTFRPGGSVIHGTVENKDSRRSEGSSEHGDSPIVTDLAGHSTRGGKETSRRSIELFPHGSLDDGSGLSQDGQDTQEPDYVLVSGYSSNSGRGTRSNFSSDTAEGEDLVSLGASAIDLFDQSGAVPTAAVESASLEGMSREASQKITRKSNLCGRRDGDERTAPVLAPEAPITVRPPLAAGAPVGIRGRKGRQRDVGGTTDFARKTPPGNEFHARGTSERWKPPLAGGTLSRNSRASPFRGTPPKAAGVVEDNRKLRRGSRTGCIRGSRPDRQDGETPLAISSHRKAAAATETGVRDKSSARVRRRWSDIEKDGGGTDDTGRASTTIELGGGREGAGAGAGGGRGGRGESEQQSSHRLASAQARLHKDKDLKALKSEHVEALVILQDISAPSTAGVEATATVCGGAIVESDSYAPAVAKQQLLERSAAKVCPSEENIKAETGPVAVDAADADVDLLSANLPRIGFQEQAALRLLYRKWWMKLANGAGPLPSTPDMLEMAEAGLIKGAQDIDERDALPTSPMLGKGCRRAEQDTSASIDGYPDGTAADIGEEKKQFHTSCIVAQTSTVASRRRADVTRAGKSTSYTVKKGGVLASVLAETSPALGSGKRDESTAGKLGNDGRKVSGNCDGKGAPGETMKQTDASLNLTRVPGDTFESSQNAHQSRSQTAVIRDAPQAGSTTQCTIGATLLDKNGSRVRSEIMIRSVFAACEEPCGNEDATIASRTPQTQHVESDVESGSDDDGFEPREEEGLHGRIYLPDGRFVSTRHVSIKGDNVEGKDVSLEDSTGSDEGDPPSEYGGDNFEA